MKLPRLYPIVDMGTLRRRQVEPGRFVQELLAGGAEILQLRDKDGSPQETLKQAAVISKLVSGGPCLPVMNDRADLAALAEWTAVHVGHLDLPPDAVRRVFGPAPVVVGVSTHNDDQVRAAERGSADYIAVGPVFATGTKADAEPVIGLPGVRRARELSRKPLVAIGGVTRENAAAVLDAGADSVAVIGGLFVEGESTEAVVQDFLRRLR